MSVLACIGALLTASGDDTVRSRVMDIARKLAWPERYTARVFRAFTKRWHGRERELLAVADEEAEKYRRAWLEGDPEGSNTFIGEAVGLIRSIEPAGEVLQRMAREAEDLLSGGGRALRAIIILGTFSEGPHPICIVLHS